VTRRVILVLVLTVGMAIAGHVDGAWRAAALAPPHRAIPEPPFPNRIDSAGSSEPSLLDIHGNEIETAVGDYRIDPRGGIYERHAPDTAVIALGPPAA
jgi:hypothetical protein